MARLSQKQRNEIITRYLAGETISSLAKSYNVSYQAIAKQLTDEKVQESSKKVKEQEALSMIAYIEAKKR